MRLRRLFVGWVTLLLIAPFAAAQKSPEIRVTSEEVTINVRFTDRFNRGVTDIQPNEIRIFEDGKEQKLERFFRSEEPFHVALLLDMSPSTTFVQAGIRDRSADFVAQMPEGNRLLVVTFEDQVFIDCDWTQDLQKAMDTIEGLQWNEKADSTHLYEAISLVAQKKFKRSAPRKALILYSDGIDMGSHDFSRDESLALIEESGILVYTIQFDSRDWWMHRGRSVASSRSPNDPDYDPRYPDGRRPGYDPRDTRRPQSYPTPPDNEPDDEPGVQIPNPVPPISGPGGVVLGRNTRSSQNRQEAQWLYESGMTYLRKLAMVSSGKYFQTPNIDALGNAYSQIIQELSDLYTITYIPSPRKTDGQIHRIKIDVTRPDVAVQTTKGGYLAKEK